MGVGVRCGEGSGSDEKRTAWVHLVSKNCTAGRGESRFKDKEEDGIKRTGDGKTNRHKDPDKVVDDFERGPFLCAEELPGSRGKNESVPSGDGQRADEEVLVSREMRGKLERVRKESCVWRVGGESEEREIGGTYR